MFYPKYFPQQEEPLCKPFLGNWIKKTGLVKFANLLFGFFFGGFVGFFVFFLSYFLQCTMGFTDKVTGLNFL